MTRKLGVQVQRKYRDISNMAKPFPVLTYYLSAICTITDNPDDLASS